MSSLNGSMPPGGASAPGGGIQMGGGQGQMPDGGGSFYMGGDDPGQQQQQQGGYQNPELMFVDPNQLDRKSYNRQYLETLITGRDEFWSNPWEIDAEENLKFRGRKDLVTGGGSNKKFFFINA
jgi:hypothetical protein